MSSEPNKEWVDAAEAAAARLFESLEKMGDVELNLHFPQPEEAALTNSSVDSFLDYLDGGEHLGKSFLANAKDK